MILVIAYLVGETETLLLDCSANRLLTLHTAEKADRLLN